MKRKHVKEVKAELEVTPFTPGRITSIGRDDEVALSFSVHVPGWLFDEEHVDDLKRWLHARMDRLVDDMEVR